MSAAAYLVIRCDRPDYTQVDRLCGAEGSWAGDVDSHTHLRWILREYCGWSRRKDPRTGRMLDLCPACSEVVNPS